MKTRFKLLTISLCLGLLTSFQILGQTYSTNLDDADGSYLSGKITPIGDLGDIKSILDLRGFIPISCASKAKTKKQLSSVLNFFTDDFQYYQYPPISSIANLYLICAASFQFHVLQKRKPRSSCPACLIFLPMTFNTINIHQFPASLIFTTARMMKKLWRKFRSEEHTSELQ